ncbi:hypothetical protein C8T65DRAFT_77404 [Cerioporus squamosus]|nr:hypothetical protein C8T65DRAFT_77404 [Cerioporus squamosus]
MLSPSVCLPGCKPSLCNRGDAREPTESPGRLALPPEHKLRHRRPLPAARSVPRSVRLSGTPPESLPRRNGVDSSGRRAVYPSTSSISRGRYRGLCSFALGASPGELPVTVREPRCGRPRMFNPFSGSLRPSLRCYRAPNSTYDIVTAPAGNQRLEDCIEVCWSVSSPLSQSTHLISASCSAEAFVTRYPRARGCPSSFRLVADA